MGNTNVRGGLLQTNNEQEGSGSRSLGYFSEYKKHIDRIPIGVFTLFIGLTFLIPQRRGLPKPPDAVTNIELGIFTLLLWTPIFVGLFLLILRKQNIPTIVSVRVLSWITTGSLFGFLILTVIDVPGLWWTWITLGVHLATVMLVACLAKGKIGELRALGLGVGITCLAAGIWEVPYQIGYFYHYDLPQNIDVAYLFVQPMRVAPLYLGGFILSIVLYRGQQIPYHSIVLLGLTGGLLTYWITGYMWVDIYYDWERQIWIQTEEFNTGQAILYRSSKATLALGLAGLYIKGKGVQVKTFIGYILIVPWTMIFIATTGFLGFTWVKSLFAKEGDPPYFKTRSIHYDRKHNSPDGGGRN